MKLCLICGHVDTAGRAETCPKCGEGSWKPIAAEPAPKPEPKPTKPAKRERY